MSESSPAERRDFKNMEEHSYICTSLDGQQLIIKTKEKSHGEVRGKDVFGNHLETNQILELSFDGPTGSVSLMEIIPSEIIKQNKLFAAQQEPAWGIGHSKDEVITGPLNNPFNIGTILHEFGHAEQDTEERFNNMLTWYEPHTRAEGIILPSIIKKIAASADYQLSPTEIAKLDSLKIVTLAIHAKTRELGLPVELTANVFGYNTELDALCEERHRLLWQNLRAPIVAAHNALEIDANNREKAWLAQLGQRIGIDFAATKWALPQSAKDSVLDTSSDILRHRYGNKATEATIFEWSNWTERSHIDIQPRPLRSDKDRNAEIDAWPTIKIS